MSTLWFVDKFFFVWKASIVFSGTQKCYLVLQNIKTESFRFVFMQKTFMESFDNVRVYKEYSGALHSVESSSEFCKLKESNSRLVRTGFQ